MSNLINIMTFTAYGIIIDYIIALVISIALALVLRLPLLPSRPIRYSFDVSALYPTPLIAIGLFSIFFAFNCAGTFMAVISGVFAAIFVKYLFFMVFPKPLEAKE